VEPFLCGALVRKFKLRHYQRGACLSYAAVQLLIALPLYLLVLPRDTEQLTANAARTDPAATTPGRSPKLGTMVVLAMTLTVAAVISSTLSVHLLTILQSNGMALAAAVGLGALVGPSQVGARAIEMIVARYHHPIWTKFASVTFVAIGVSALWAGLPIIPLALAFYGAGIGLESIARGTLPLALFGPSGYAKLMGRLTAQPARAGGCSVCRCVDVGAGRCPEHAGCTLPAGLDQCRIGVRTGLACDASPTSADKSPVKPY
jgi:hypothetical protein